MPSIYRWAARAALAAILGLPASAAADTAAAVLQRAGAFLKAPRLEQLAAGLSNAPAVFAASPCLYYPVAAMSGIMRLPADLPLDAPVNDRMTLCAAPGEIEAASFLIYALEPFKRVTLETGPLASPSGTLPAAAIDLRVVKCWYQGYTAWARHVPRRGWPWKLTPELLLHDETLVDVRVETNRNVSNYIRLDKPDGPEYLWVREFSPTESTPKGVPSWAYPEVLP
ncbi:MAG: hypothetical protein GX571_05425, partial [Lentisphaerae bacterium]|nr:hypothetical protein [Lentisphaerota bacterium]